MEHGNFPDNEDRLSEVFGDLHWPTLRSLTLSGITIPKHEVFLAFLSPYEPTLRALHIRKFNDIWASGKWEPLMKELRDGYAVEESRIQNFCADDDVGDGPQCGR